MKKIYLLFITVLAVTFCNAQLTGTKNIPGDYGTLAAAITDLNAQGVGAGGVTLNMIAGNPETAPAGGYVIGNTGSLVLTTSSSSNPVIITGNGNIITTSAALTAGALNDAVFKIIGADYITLQGFTMQENGANTTTTTASNNMTEWGVALLHVSVTDGAQNNTIQNNTISLNRTYTNTFGVYSNNRHSATTIATTQDITNNTTGPNNGNKVYGNNISNVNMGIAFIGTAAAANQDSGNDIGGTSSLTGNTITNWGGAGAVSGYVSNSGTSYCIFMNHQTGDNVSYNTINSASISGTAVTLRAIYKDYTTTAPTGTFTTNINNNTITITDNFTSGTLEHIRSQGMTTLSTATININNNTIVNSAVAGTASSTGMVCIANSSVPGTLNINGNAIKGLTSKATTGGFTGIINTGAVVTGININNNQIGTSLSDAVTFSVATSGVILGISNTGGAAAGLLTVTGNDFRGIVNTVTGTGTQTYINQTSTGSINISSNTFTNLTANTTKTVTFITDGTVTHAANSTKNLNNNSIVTAFNKSASGGTVIFYTSQGSSGTTVTEFNNGNNFSNVTAAGITTILGWDSEDGVPPGPHKTVNNNTFNNITCGTGVITGILIVGFGDVSAAGSNVSGNTISNITGAGNIAGIVTSSGNNNFFNNTVTGISSTGTGAVVLGMSVTGGTAVNIFKNNINNIQADNATASVTGISVTGGTTTTIYNNFISDLRTPSSNAVTPVIAISTATSATNIYYNTIVLGNAATLTSTGANFGATGIQYAAANIKLNNNIIWIDATPTGTGTVAAIRKATAGTAGTAPSATLFAANNNIYNVKTPGVNKYLYVEGTTLGAVKNGYGINIGIADDVTNNLKNDGNFNSTCSLYKMFMSGGREAATFNEDNLTASGTPNFTFSPTGSSYAESGGIAIASPAITDDYGNVVRSTPSDIGALEFAGTAIDGTPPAISFSNILNTACITSIPVLNAVITDASGINTTPGTAPRLYFRKGGATAEADIFLNYPAENTSAFNGWKYVEATGTAPNFTFTLNYSLLTSPVADGDSITYFVIAQDLNGVPNISKNTVTFPTTFCPSSVVLPPSGAVPTSLSLGYKISSVTGNYVTVANGEWNNPGTWACAAIPPTNSTNVVIANNITVSNSGNTGGSVTINPGASLTMNTGGVLTLGNTGGDKISFINNGTLNVTDGVLNVNGNVVINNGSNFSQAAGLISVDGNSGGVPAGSVPAGTDIFTIGTAAVNYSTGSISLTGGTLQIVDPHAGTTGTNLSFAYYGTTAPVNNITTGANFNLQMGDGVSTDQGGTANGFDINLAASLNAGLKPNLVVNAPAGTNRTVISGLTFIGLQNLTILNGEMSTTAVTAVVNKNILVNTPGIFTAGTTSVLTLGDLTFNGGASVSTSASVNPQSIGGSGIFRNIATGATANLTSFTTFNSNASGITLNTPITVSTTFTMTGGVINTSATNLLTLGTGTTAGTVGTLTYTAGIINGPYKKWVRTNASSYQFPVGTATTLKPATIAFTTAPTTGGTLTANWSAVPPAAPAPALVEPVGTLTVDAVSSSGSWFINAADGLAGGAYTATFTGNNTTDIVDYTKAVLVKRPSGGGAWILDGTHQGTTGSNTAPVLSRTGMSGFSEFAIGGQALFVVPVSIEYFRGSKLTGSDYLSWKVTCTSSPSVELVLERSADGKKFSTIEDQNATAVRCLQEFSYTDATPLAGANYYRLKIITLDGVVRYSAIVLLLNKDKGYEFVNLAPNPTKGMSVLTVTTAKAGKMDLSVTDVTGKLIMKQTVVMIAGSNTVNIDFSALNAGTYQVTGVSSDGEINTIRFVKY